jgi:hypothetical protein
LHVATSNISFNLSYEFITWYSGLICRCALCETTSQCTFPACDRLICSLVPCLLPLRNKCTLDMLNLYSLRQYSCRYVRTQISPMSFRLSNHKCVEAYARISSHAHINLELPDRGLFLKQGIVSVGFHINLPNKMFTAQCLAILLLIDRFAACSRILACPQLSISHAALKHHSNVISWCYFFISTRSW